MSADKMHVLKNDQGITIGYEGRTHRVLLSGTTLILIPRPQKKPAANSRGSWLDKPVPEWMPRSHSRYRW